MECVQPTIPETEKSTPSLADFHYTGYVIAGKFIPTRACIQADTLEDQEAVQAFLAEAGLSCLEKSLDLKGWRLRPFFF